MRTWTIGLSVIFHLCLIGGVIVAPLVATDVLPTPPRVTLEPVLVSARLPDPPVTRSQAPRTSSAAAPVQPPDRIVDEPVLEAAPTRDEIDLSFGTSPGPVGTEPVPGTHVEETTRRQESTDERTGILMALPGAAALRISGEMDFCSEMTAENVLDF